MTADVRPRFEAWKNGTAEFLSLAFTAESIRNEFLAPIQEAHPLFRKLGMSTTELLREEVHNLVERLDHIRSRLPFHEAVAEVTPGDASPIGTRVFVVYGHDHALRDQVELLLRRLQLDPIVLETQPGESQTIIEKVEAHGQVDYAVVLLTPDDVGGSAASPSDLRPRARQNVVLELGYFIGRIGRTRVAVLRASGDLEAPGDVDGVIYTYVDDAGEWRKRLAKNIRSAGLADLSGL